MNLTGRIKSLAQELGFDEVGMTQPETLAEGERAIQDWTAKERHGEMKFMEEFAARRERFYRDFPDAKSVIVLGVNYYSETTDNGRQTSDTKGKIARYAWGKDYHKVIAAKHKALIARLQQEFGESFRAKSCVDTQPIPERFAATKAGLGFIGKHTGLLNQKFGPWLFLSEIVTNLELEESLYFGDGSGRDRSKLIIREDLSLPEPSPGLNGCGPCTHCQDICPTGALDKDYNIDAKLCIAYLTIEHKGVIPRELRPKIKNWIFGCDECLVICPFTSKQKETTWPEFKAEAGLGPELDLDELFSVTSNSQYEKKFAGTALLRASRKQMLRNACIVLGNSGREEALPYLAKALCDPAPLVRLHAAWALGQLGFVQAKQMLQEAQSGEKDPEVRSEIAAALHASAVDKSQPIVV